MKYRFVLSLILFFAVSSFSFAQLRIGYVDSDAIMSQLPDAQDARKEIDNLIQEWQAELRKLETEWKTKYEDYERRKLIMSDQTRADLEKELVQMEQNITQYREKKFGTNGELFLKQEELMKPILNKVFAVIKEVATEENYDYIFDRSSELSILFAKEEFDLTSLVLSKLKQ